MIPQFAQFLRHLLLPAHIAYSPDDYDVVPFSIVKVQAGCPEWSALRSKMSIPAALREVWPETKEQRCWKHKLADVLDMLPKCGQARAKDLLRKIMHAPDRESALQEIDCFPKEYQAHYSKAAGALPTDKDQFLAFFDFPAEHWIHLRTTDPIESPFATLKARTKRTKGAGSRKAGVAMAFKLLLDAQSHWQQVNAPHLVALVKASVAYPGPQGRYAQPAERIRFGNRLGDQIGPRLAVYAHPSGGRRSCARPHHLTIPLDPGLVLDHSSAPIGS